MPIRPGLITVRGRAHLCVSSQSKGCLKLAGLAQLSRASQIHQQFCGGLILGATGRTITAGQCMMVGVLFPCVICTETAMGATVTIRTLHEAPLTAPTGKGWTPHCSWVRVGA